MIDVDNEEELERQLKNIDEEFKRSTFKNVAHKNKQMELIEKEIRHKVDSNEEQEMAKEEQNRNRLQRRSYFMRLMDYNQPRINILIGITVSILQGALMPIFGGVMAKMLFVLMDIYDYTEMRSESDKWCGLMLGFAFIAFLTGFGQKFSFGVIGENVTTNIRKVLYGKIIEKNQGWFDLRENAPGILTSTLASDA